jgi:hypothetical protein
MNETPDCDRDSLGLAERQLAALTGFTSRAVRALAHLREAWAVGDDDNRDAVEAGIRALVQGHSLADIPDICRAVLTVGLDAGPAAQFLRQVGLDARATARSLLSTPRRVLGGR